MDVNHFNDERVNEVMSGAALTPEERTFLILDTASFEECELTQSELAAMNDASLMSVAYGVWADYANSIS